MGVVDYSELEQEITGAEEPKVLPAGTEVKGRIVKVNTGVSDNNGCAWYMPIFDVPDDPMVNEFSDFFWELDREHLDPKSYQRTLYKLKTFVAAFDIDLSTPLSWEDDLIRKEGWMILGIRKSEEYGEQNTVRKYIHSTGL